MAPLKHTYGPTCHLARNAAMSTSKGYDDDIPVIKAQFFYSSPLPIDDPLTAVPASSAAESKVGKQDPRPFSAYDNNALEEAWMGLRSEQDRKHHRKLRDSALKPLTKTQAAKRASIVSELASKHNKKHAKEAFFEDSTAANNKKMKAEGLREGRAGCDACLPTASNIGQGLDAESPNRATHMDETHHSSIDSKIPICCAELESDAKAEQRKAFGGIFKRKESHADHDNFLRDVMEEAHRQKNSKATYPIQVAIDGSKTSTRKLGPAQGGGIDDNSKERSMSPSHPTSKHGEEAVSKRHDSKEHKAFEKHYHSKEHQVFEKHMTADRAIGTEQPSNSDPNSNFLPVPDHSETGISGSPFQRVTSRNSSPGPSSRPQSPSLMVQEEQDDSDAVESSSGNYPGGSHRPQIDSAATIYSHKCKAHKDIRAVAEVPVGISRLHLVKLPDLLMMPIYWSPVHDIAAVTRGTWFYKDTMYPVEAAVANQLEIGYRNLRPWSQTWNDELNSAIDVGAAGEEKVSHRLWPKESDQKIIDKADQNFMPTDPYCAARCFGGAVAATGVVNFNSDEKTAEQAAAPKRFPNCHVMYKDSRNAFILKPSLQPSEYYGRRPLAKIKRGTVVGLHVVRGFDWRQWEKLHPLKRPTSVIKAEEAAPVAGNADAGDRAACSACREQEERPKVTDLVLVIHGIGQKLSERVESFHFTHAINAFRRSVNIELGNEAVQNVFRKDLGGIMVLPINWRSNLSFEDGGPMKPGDKVTNATVSDFSLRDITPETIPAVRSVISEVVLDIPFYMSSHRAKMNEALVTEANRVFRLWCKNNPEFQEEGRVHIIAHSLGSAMALDVLSKQPTSAVGRFDLQSKKISSKIFEFDTKNLFFAGSPAGFFLLLDKGRLMPRRGRNKPGANYADDIGKELTGEVGTFGCLAVDNLYNVIHQNDPIAYRLNATVDALYASSLQTAHVPSATIGWLDALSSAVRAFTPGASAAPDLGVGQIAKPVVARLPSQLEMEVHDFTREEVAEKKFYLLNDNGQIDYFLSSGGGPLEIQYLNMLSAHSSYWVSPDFVRMLVTEVGRKPGRSNTLPNMRATKKIERK